MERGSGFQGRLLELSRPMHHETLSVQPLAARRELRIASSLKRPDCSKDCGEDLPPSGSQRYLVSEMV